MVLFLAALSVAWGEERLDSYQATVTLLDPGTRKVESRIRGRLDLRHEGGSHGAVHVVRATLSQLSVEVNGVPQSASKATAFDQTFALRGERVYATVRREFSEGETFFEHSILALCAMTEPNPRGREAVQVYTSVDSRTDPDWRRTLTPLGAGRYRVVFAQGAWPGIAATGEVTFEAKTGRMLAATLVADPLRVAVDGEKMRGEITLKLIRRDP